MSNQTEKYDAATIALHWITALLVVVLWVIGRTAHSLPRGAFQTDYWSTHVALGFALAALFLIRIGWRSTAGRGLPAADSGIVHVLAKASHYGLYLLLLIVLVLGVANAFVRGFPLYGLFRLPQLGDPELRKPITHWHGLVANVLLGLAAFHALAALVHQFILRDGVFRRMMPGPRPV